MLMLPRPGRRARKGFVALRGPCPKGRQLKSAGMWSVSIDARPTDGRLLGLRAQMCAVATKGVLVLMLRVVTGELCT